MSRRLGLLLRLAARARLVSFLATIGVSGVAVWVAADVFLVTNTNDDGPGSLRDAIRKANQNPGADQITFDPSLAGQYINLTSGELAITDEVTIDGLGASPLTVRRYPGALSYYRVFNIDDGGPAEVAVTLRNLTIARGDVVGEGEVGGGGIRSTENLTLEGCLVANNELYSTSAPLSMGGGVYSSGTLTITGSTISGNKARARDYDNAYVRAKGGGVYSSGDLTLTGSTITGNWAQTGGYEHLVGEGGGVYSSGSLLVRSSTISNNTLEGGGDDVELYGGGIASSGALEIRSSTITDNRASSGLYGNRVHGGGVFSSGSLLVARSTFSNNSCEAVDVEGGRLSGGGLEGNGQVWSSTFDHNSADCSDSIVCHAYGGGLYGELGVYNSTVVGNTAVVGFDSDSAGGGFYATSDARLVSTIVSGNSVEGYKTAGPDLFAQDGWQLAHHNLVGDPADSGLTIGEDGNITGDPELGPLLPNGGPTLTCAIPLSSPAVNAGSNPLQLIADQRGFEPRDAYGATDIGAYENGAIDLEDLLFADSFELGDTSGWPLALP